MHWRRPGGITLGKKIALITMLMVAPLNYSLYPRAAIKSGLRELINFANLGVEDLTAP